MLGLACSASWKWCEPHREVISTVFADQKSWNHVCHSLITNKGWHRHHYRHDRPQVQSNVTQNQLGPSATRGPNIQAYQRPRVGQSLLGPETLPSWLMEECYVQRIQPLLRDKKGREIAEAMQVSQPYAACVRSGRRRLHPRHWKALAWLVGVPAENL